MTRTDIIELANQLTERKAEKMLSLNLVFSTVVQDICKRFRFWWRKLDVTFTMTQNTTTYDFTTITTTPTLSEIAVAEIIQLAIIIQAVNPFQDSELTPIFDGQGFREMKNNTVQAQPGRYTMGVDDWKTLRIDPPDKSYTAEMTFWAMPIIDTDVAATTVPLIPPYDHDTIVAGMEAAINRRVYGPDDRRFVGAQQQYEAKLLNMMVRKQFTTNYNEQWISSDSTAYVQGTAPNSSSSQ